MPSPSPKTSYRKTSRRRADVARRRGSLWSKLVRAARTRAFGWAVLISLAYFAIGVGLWLWAREHKEPAVGRVMTQSHVSRVRVSLPDLVATESARQEARLNAPRVYIAESAVFESLRNTLLSLPGVLADKQSLDEVSPLIVSQFNLTPITFDALRRQFVDGRPTDDWTESVAIFIDQLMSVPILDDATWQIEKLEGDTGTLRLDIEGRDSRVIPDGTAVNIASTEAVRELGSRLSRVARFRGALRDIAVAALVHENRPTYRFDEAATRRGEEQAEAAVGVRMREIPEGFVIYRRGDVLTRTQADLVAAERRVYYDSVASWRFALRQLAPVGAAGVLTLGLVAYLALFCPTVRRSPARMLGIGVLLGSALAAATLASILAPGWVHIAAVGPVLLAAVVLVIVYDQRVALAISALLALQVGLTCGLDLGMFALTICGSAVAITELREIRDRRVFVRLGCVLGVVLALASALVQILEGPVTGVLLHQIWQDSLLAGFGGLVVAGTMMFMLPSLERWFDIVTGMTLIELRDPKNPLLRELQQRAPGTYNHSLTVAAIAEAAADAVGADGLLTYVGSLYHDIGKMNKPEYFVENQGGGPNKHDRLSPAMSLLVIVGHVKDGIEMAREYGLPRPLIHFIEAHHGTTLVEFFFRRAKDQAEQAARDRGEGTDGGDGAGPAEFDYRYPGPKPQTREVAIIMLADSVESATRTLSEPTPARIDALVRSLANKRLLDGQFDECNLTFKDLTIIVESISKTLAAIYHGRIAYPSESRAPETKTRQLNPPTTPPEQRLA
ncbi:MAG: HDIG domain-containing protein [Phycisphaeraceae bacterium]|nr:HDIG domain-containing protein [Phycisphaeraceae bacterium]MCW5754809.1 HDIG domain-containing protein [Phycisphaeraceae bacterium]